MTADRRPLDSRRTLAFFIDLVVVGVPTWIFLSVVAAHYGGGFGILAIATALQLSYHYVCEVTTGQTVGKRAMGLRVVSLDGGLPDLRQASGRTVLRLIDQSPPIIGLLVMLLSGRRRGRLGDLLARTAVVDAAEHPVTSARWTPKTFGYPFAWVAPALVLFGFWSTGHFPGTYRAEADELCASAFADVGSAPDLTRVMASYDRLVPALVQLDVPANWRARHQMLISYTADERTRITEVVDLHGRGRDDLSRARYAELADIGQDHNLRLADAGYNDCAGRR